MPLSAAPKRLAVTYGNFVFTDANGIALQGRDRSYVLEESHQDGFFSVDFVLRLVSPSGVEATDDQAMAVLIRAAYENLHQRRAKLLVSLNGNVVNGNGNGWDPASNVRSAFLIESHLEKIGSPLDNGRRITFRFSVRCQFPATTTDSRRRESSTLTFDGVNGRRICIIRAVLTGYANVTALESYNTNADAFFTSRLPAPVASGEWVQVSADPAYDDENVVIGATRVYWEVVSGLREYRVDVNHDANGARQVVISGLYMTTAANSARTNYTNNVAALIATVLAAEGGASNYEGVSTPKVTGYDTTGKLYRFTHTHNEIVYPQGTSTDDPNVTAYTLTVKQISTFDPQTITRSNPVTRLRRARAFYTAVIDKTSSGGTDLYALWTSKLRSYVISAVATKLGSLSVVVEDEDVGPTLDGNVLTATLDLLVRGGNVLRLKMGEKVTRTPSVELTPQGDGEVNSFYPDRVPSVKILERVAIVQYSGGVRPALWGPGEQGSGYTFIDTKHSIEEVLDAIDGGALPGTPCWFPLAPFVEESNPTSEGEDDSFQTVTYVRAERWQYVQKFAAPLATVEIAE